MLFRHTYLYIKQHTITGKLYFGKTVRNPITYNGSGTHWVNHINKYGKVNVVTLWYQLYDNVFDLVADALSMSKSFDIVNNSSWLNQIPECGIGGSLGGCFHPQFNTTVPEYRKLKISKSLLGRKLSKETIEKMKKPKSKQHIINSSLGRTGLKSPIKNRIAKCKKINVLLPCGIVLHDTTRLEISITYGLNFNCLKSYFLRGMCYKGFYLV